MNAETGKVRRGRKFDQVVAGARDVFLADGFEGANVDDIARAACVSKATLYSYFPDKRLLFMEVCSTQCQAQADEAVQSIDMSQPPSIVLRQAGMRILSFITSPMGQSFFRTCAAEADRFPEIGRKFYETGPKIVRLVIMGYLEMAIERGELKIDDLQMAADQFAELCKADIWTRCIFGVSASFTEEEMTRNIDEAVTTFLARYGT